jgi:hypothetical protein
MQALDKNRLCKQGAWVLNGRFFLLCFYRLGLAGRDLGLVVGMTHDIWFSVAHTIRIDPHLLYCNYGWQLERVTYDT